MIRLYAVLAILASIISGCTAKVPKPPIVLPFAVHQAGSTVITDLLITEKGPYKYPFSLHFYFKDNDRIDEERVSKLVGDGGINKYGNPSTTGVSIPLQITLTVVDSSGERPFFKKEIFVGGLESRGNNRFTRNIEHIRLDPAHYRVVIKSPNNIPELAETNVIFGIYNPRR